MKNTSEVIEFVYGRPFKMGSEVRDNSLHFLYRLYVENILFQTSNRLEGLLDTKKTFSDYTGNVYYNKFYQNGMKRINEPKHLSGHLAQSHLIRVDNQEKEVCFPIVSKYTQLDFVIINGKLYKTALENLSQIFDVLKDKNDTLEVIANGLNDFVESFNKCLEGVDREHAKIMNLEEFREFMGFSMEKNIAEEVKSKINPHMKYQPTDKDEIKRL